MNRPYQNAHTNAHVERSIERDIKYVYLKYDVTMYTSQIFYLNYIQSHIKHIVQYTIQATMQIHALSAKQVSKEAPRLTCQ